MLLQLLLFSWTLVMTQRGSDLYKDYSESKKYIEKGLITEEENTYLKVHKMEYWNITKNIIHVDGDRRVQ